VNPVQFADGGKTATAEPPKPQDAAAHVVSAGFKSSNPNHSFRYEWVNLNDTTIDPRIQRGEEGPEIAHIIANFNKAALGTFTLSRRPNGELAVLDGQQRRAACRKVGYEEQVQAIVHSGLSLAEEAQLFLDLNYRRSVNAWTQFRVARTAGDPLAQAIGVVLDELNIPLGSPKGFSAVVMARRVAKRQGGLTHLHWALRQVQAVYDTSGDGGVYDGRVVEAFAMLYRECATIIKEDDLHKKLAQKGGGVDGLIGHGHTVQLVAHPPVKIARAIARAIALRYNVGKSKDSVHALPMI
jgi:hypothetical protein